MRGPLYAPYTNTAQQTVLGCEQKMKIVALAFRVFLLSALSLFLLLVDQGTFCQLETAGYFLLYVPAMCNTLKYCRASQGQSIMRSSVPATLAETYSNQPVCRVGSSALTKSSWQPHHCGATTKVAFFLLSCRP